MWVLTPAAATVGWSTTSITLQTQGAHQVRCKVLRVNPNRSCRHSSSHLQRRICLGVVFFLHFLIFKQFNWDIFILFCADNHCIINHSAYDDFHVAVSLKMSNILLCQSLWSNRCFSEDHTSVLLITICLTAPSVPRAPPSFWFLPLLLPAFCRALCKDLIQLWPSVISLHQNFAFEATLCTPRVAWRDGLSSLARIDSGFPSNWAAQSPKNVLFHYCMLAHAGTVNDDCEHVSHLTGLLAWLWTLSSAKYRRWKGKNNGDGCVLLYVNTHTDWIWCNDALTTL